MKLGLIEPHLEHQLAVCVIPNVAKKNFSEPIPERRRTRFAPNGGPRPTDTQRRSARRGLTASREALAATAPGEPQQNVVAPMSLEQRSAGRTGIDAARQALSA